MYLLKIPASLGIAGLLHYYGNIKCAVCLPRGNFPEHVPQTNSQGTRGVSIFILILYSFNNFRVSAVMK